LPPGPLGNHPKLQDSTSSECHDDDRSDNHREQQRYGKR
jgi:hypothetical protein